MTRSSMIGFGVVLWALLAGVACQNINTSVGLALDTPLDGSISPPNYAFYSVTLPEVIPNGSVLLITADSSNKMLHPGTSFHHSVIFIS